MYGEPRSREIKQTLTLSTSLISPLLALFHPIEARGKFKLRLSRQTA